MLFYNFASPTGMTQMTQQQKSTTSPFDIDHALEQGAASLRRREWRQAHDLFQPAVNADGAPPAAWEGLATTQPTINAELAEIAEKNCSLRALRSLRCTYNTDYG